jgi:alcohol dehydrogenase class IV
LSIFEDCLAFAKDKGADIFIGLGGGSALDIAKVVSCIAMYGGAIEDYIAPPIGKGAPIKGPGYFNIAIPTTSGTGSEVSPAAVVSLVEKELKVGISSQNQRPNLALLDPLLTVSSPPHITASTGIDVLTHGIEGYTTPWFQAKARPEDPMKRPVYGGATPVSDLYNQKAIELVAQNLRKAYNRGDDVEARANMALASLFAGIGFTNAGLGAVHAMSFPLGGKFHVPHGMANATLLPHVMEFNAKSNFTKFKHIAEMMGEDVLGLSEREAALRSVTAVKELCADVGIPSSIKEFGVKESDLKQMSVDTLKIQRLLSGNPRRVSEEDALEILKNAYASD